MFKLSATFTDGRTITRTSKKPMGYAVQSTNVQASGIVQRSSGFASKPSTSNRFGKISGTTTTECVETVVEAIVK